MASDNSKVLNQIVQKWNCLAKKSNDLFLGNQELIINVEQENCELRKKLKYFENLGKHYFHMCVYIFPLFSIIFQQN